MASNFKSLPRNELQFRCAAPDKKGVRLAAKEMEALEAIVKRLPGLEKRFVEVPPEIPSG